MPEENYTDIEISLTATPEEATAQNYNLIYYFFSIFAIVPISITIATATLCIYSKYQAGRCNISPTLDQPSTPSHKEIKHSPMRPFKHFQLPKGPSAGSVNSGGNTLCDLQILDPYQTGYIISFPGSSTVNDFHSNNLQSSSACLIEECKQKPSGVTVLDEDA